MFYKRNCNLLSQRCPGDIRGFRIRNAFRIRNGIRVDEIGGDEISYRRNSSPWPIDEIRIRNCNFVYEIRIRMGQFRIRNWNFVYEMPFRIRISSPGGDEIRILENFRRGGDTF